MKPVPGYLKAVIITLMAAPLLAAGCDGEDNVGYHSIPIPEYKMEHYYAMLQSSNEEIQYNAICNLRMETDAELLLKDSLKSTPNYKLTKQVYDKVYSMMLSKNTWVSSAAIRYIDRFTYNRTNFIHDILNNNNASVNVQLAIMDSWNGEDDYKSADSAAVLRKIKFCLQHPSWLIQQCAYYYITASTAHQLEADWIKAYQATKEQYKKLLYIDALNNHLCDTIFDFLTREYSTSSDTMLQQLILQSLPRSLNRQHALQWYTQHKKETALTLKHGNNRDIYPSLALIALEQGWDPADIQLYSNEKETGPVLYYYVLENKYRYEHTDSVKPEQDAAYKKIEQQLLANKRFKSSWLNYEQTHIRYALPEQLIVAHRQLTAKYAEDVKQLFKQYKIDSSAYEDFFVPLENNASSLYKKKFPNKPTE